MPQPPPDEGMMKALATALRNWRLREGLNQVEAALRLGVSYGSYQDYEEAQAMPRPGRLRQISEATGLPIIFLIGEPDELASWAAAMRAAESEAN
jgi:transcriptional regulator with XRE-family HTH domain